VAYSQASALPQGLPDESKPHDPPLEQDPGTVLKFNVAQARLTMRSQLWQRAQRWRHAINVCTALSGPLHCSHCSPCCAATSLRHQCEPLQATGQEAADGSLDASYPEAARGVILVGGLPDRFFVERYMRCRVWQVG